MFGRLILLQVFFEQLCFLFLSDKSEKLHNPAIFVKLTYGHFDILMCLYGEARNILPFRAISR